ncbi:MAG: S1 family peptidase [Lysobacteraceae bacterium]
MRKTFSMAGLVLSPLAAAFVLIATTASASPQEDTIAPALRQAMKRDLSLTDAQLGQYLQTERLARQQAKLLEQQQGRQFAGSWIERKGNGDFQLVVATTRSTAQKAAPGIAIRNARHTLAELQDAKGQLDMMLKQGARAPRGVYSWSVDVTTNSVVVGVGTGGQLAAIDFIARSGADAKTLRFVTMDEQPTLRSTLQGGLGYLRNPGDGYLYACSIGFNVTKNGTPGYVSAGHCGDAGEAAYLEGASGTGPQWTLGSQIGTFQGSTFPNPGSTGTDMAWIQISGGHTQSASVYGWGSGDVTVKGSAEAAVGAAICRSGRTSGWRCGAIKAKNVTVNYQSGETIVNLTQTTACSEGGDSGGSFITGTGQGQGVLSGGSGNCKGRAGKPGGGNSYYQPLVPLLSYYGLTLTRG